MGVTMRPSTSALVAVGRGIEAKRDRLISEWARWINNRLASIEHIKRETIERQLALLVDILIEMAGAPRRKSTELWLSAAEWYGRTAAERGLAAGEVVEEFQYLRELLIRELSELIATLQPRQSMASVLRLNRLLDKSIAHAVVGYTDTLVETLLNQRGVPVGALDAADTELEKRLKQLSAELDRIRKQR
jgi:hypothetical protein